MTDTEFMASDAAYAAATGHGDYADAVRVEQIAERDARHRAARDAEWKRQTEWREMVLMIAGRDGCSTADARVTAWEQRLGMTREERIGHAQVFKATIERFMSEQ